MVGAARAGVAPLGRYDAYQRPAAPRARSTRRRCGGRAAGAAGVARGARRRAAARGARASSTGCTAARRTCCAAWCSARTSGSSRRCKTDFQRSGLAHLLAVSGQNVMLLGILVLFCGRTARAAAARAAAARARPRRGLRAARGRRAVDPARGRDGRGRAGRGAGGPAVVALVRDRPRGRGHARAQPARALAEPGWQLSFAAVIALLVLRPPLRDAVRARAAGRVAEAAAMTVAATIGTAPLLAFHFEQVSVASLPANLLAAPAVAPIMWLGMLSAAAAQVSPALAAPLNALDGPLLAYLARARARRRRRRPARWCRCGSGRPACSRSRARRRSRWRRRCGASAPAPPAGAAAPAARRWRSPPSRCVAASVAVALQRRAPRVPRRPRRARRLVPRRSGRATRR